MSTARREVAVAGHVGGVETARRGLHDQDGAVRATALGALDRLGALEDEVLAGALADADPQVRRRASELAATHPEVDLRTVLVDDEALVAEAAAWACGERGSASGDVIAALVSLATGSDDPLVRESAVAALGALGDDRGLDAILAGTADKPAVRRRAVLALAPFVGSDHPRAAEVTTALERAISDRDWQVRQAAEDLS